MISIDKFRGGYSSPQAAALYANHPETKKLLADVKTRWDARAANTEWPRSLLEFYKKMDLGNGEVRIEDFHAGLSLGGVVLGPTQMANLRGAYGTDNRTIRYMEVLADMDDMGQGVSTHIAMTTRMGYHTAQLVGYGPEKTQLGATTAGTLGSTMSSTLMRSTNIQAVTAPQNALDRSTFNVTTVVEAGVTQRNKSMKPQSAAATIQRINAVAQKDALAEALRAYDPSGTGSVTLDAFLAACARAGLTIKPDELDTLRAAGTVRRPYAAAPELVEYVNVVSS